LTISPELEKLIEEYRAKLRPIPDYTTAIRELIRKGLRKEWTQYSKDGSRSQTEQ
jgi:hypothetical protein